MKKMENTPLIKIRGGAMNNGTVPGALKAGVWGDCSVVANVVRAL